MGQYNNDPNFNQDSSGAITSNYSSGSVAGWDWKQIEAALLGDAAAPSSDTSAATAATAVADPQSLWNAADTLLSVQQVLAVVAKSITDQTNALTGGSSPAWSGDAATAFTTLASSFSQYVQAAADVISGGITGNNNVPNQLYNNGNQLASAQAKIRAIDAWYANQAALQGIQPMSNGLIPVSQSPQIVSMMNNDMQAVITQLGTNYVTTVDAVQLPSTAAPPAPNTAPPGTSGGPANVPLDPYSGAGGAGTGINTSGAGVGGGTQPNIAAPAVSAFPGGTSLGSSGAAAGTGGGTQANIAAPPVSAFPGGTSLGTSATGGPGDTSVPSVAPFAGGTGLDTSGAPTGSGLGAGAPMIASIPTAGALGAGSGSTANQQVPSIASFPGGTSLAGGSGLSGAPIAGIGAAAGLGGAGVGGSGQAPHRSRRSAAGRTLAPAVPSDRALVPDQAWQTWRLPRRVLSRRLPPAALGSSRGPGCR